MKRFLVILFSFYLALAPVVSHAAGLGGWSLGAGVIQGASVIYNGSKEVILNGAKKVATGSAKITPTAANVAKTLAKGVGGVALSVAVEQLLGSVDWVLDPENNQITYTSRNTSPHTNCNDVSCVPYPILYSSETTYDEAARRGRLFATPEGACSIMVSQNGGVFKSVDTSVSPPRCYFTVGSSIYSGNIYTVANPTYDPSAQSENKPKHLPLETAAQKVISNAESGNADAQTVVKAAADTIVAEAETDSTKARPIVQQLENTQSIPTDQTAKGEAVPKENTAENPASSPTASTPSDISLDFPVFCNWAPTVCQAAIYVITQPQIWADIIADYFAEKDIPSKSNDDINLPDTPITPKTVNVNWGQQCPQPTTTTILFMGQSKDIQILRYDFICEWAWVVNASVVALASIGAVFIIAGRKT